MSHLKTALYILASIMWVGITPNAAQADPIIKSAIEVRQNMSQGEMVLLDIRSVGEWNETGLAQGAWPVSMHTPDFGLKLEKVLMLYKPEQIAIICATGGRTGYIAGLLDSKGIKGITDLSEGMIGNHRGPGWLARGLPTTTLEQAQASFDAKFSTK